jgi:hypothetical protein
MLACVVCNIFWTFFCVHAYMWPPNNILHGLAVPLVTLQGFTNWFSCAVRVDWCACAWAPDLDDEEEQLPQTFLRRLVQESGRLMQEASSTSLSETRHLSGSHHRRQSISLFDEHMKKVQCEIDPKHICIGETIGFGSSARVKKGFFMNQKVAIKMRVACHGKTFPFAENQEINALDEAREISVLLTAMHPNVVQFYGICRLPEGLGIVTELCEKSLSTAIQELRGQQAPFTTVHATMLKACAPPPPPPPPPLPIPPHLCPLIRNAPHPTIYPLPPF